MFLLFRSAHHQMSLFSSVVMIVLGRSWCCDADRHALCSSACISCMWTSVPLCK